MQNGLPEKTCKASVSEDGGDDSDDMYTMTQRDICRVNGGRGPIASILLARYEDPARYEVPFAWKHWEKHNPEAPPNGVRTCPGDVNFLLVPILDKESGDIAGYGKMSGGRCLEVSYTKEGEKEWMSFF